MQRLSINRKGHRTDEADQHPLREVSRIKEVSLRFRKLIQINFSGRPDAMVYATVYAGPLQIMLVLILQFLTNILMTVGAYRMSGGPTLHNSVPQNTAYTNSSRFPPILQRREITDGWRFFLNPNQVL